MWAAAEALHPTLRAKSAHPGAQALELVFLSCLSSIGLWLSSPVLPNPSGLIHQSATV